MDFLCLEKYCLNIFTHILTSLLATSGTEKSFCSNLQEFLLWSRNALWLEDGWAHLDVQNPVSLLPQNSTTVLSKCAHEWIKKWESQSSQVNSKSREWGQEWIAEASFFWRTSLARSLLYRVIVSVSHLSLRSCKQLNALNFHRSQVPNV